ncbi:cupredoxin domain-containing protein [Natrononativus amylolyticus]|uniref:cupredoxin domain-containing protein n=1 Tax=Natrononativus amylolyticus TaxID=2963434 RepID=UPI0020CF2697|nr:plastocyanin/azurin family copper-binding protein [Natrononativus amylolyticus]
MSPRRSPLYSRDDARSSDSRLARRRLLRTTALGLGWLAVPSRALAQDDEPAEDEEEPAEDDGDGAETGNGDVVEVAVVDYAYEPGTDSPLTIEPGTTVHWIWETDNHNIAVDSQPEESDWEGHEPIENAGFEYEHTFEVEGEYEYHCTPHIGLGMVAEIVVSENGDAGAAGPAELVPDTATTLVVATVASLVAVLGLSYVFLKYGGVSGE